MTKKLFAIKIPIKEKKALELISKETGKTITEMFYEPIKKKIEKYLGIVLLYNLELLYGQKLIHIREMEDLDNLEMYLFKQDVKAVQEFSQIINSKENRVKFASFFPNLEFQTRTFSPLDINLESLAQSLGKNYLLIQGDLDHLDENRIKHLFFDHMFLTYFNTMAKGSINQLQTFWRNNRPRMEGFKFSLMERFEKGTQAAIVRPIKDKAPPIKSPKGRDVKRRDRKMKRAPQTNQPKKRIKRRSKGST